MEKRYVRAAALCMHVTGCVDGVKAALCERRVHGAIGTRFRHVVSNLSVRVRGCRREAKGLMHRPGLGERRAEPG